MTNTETITLITDEWDSWGAAAAVDELLYLIDRRLPGVRRGIDMDLCGEACTERLIRTADRVQAADDRSWTGVQTRVLTATAAARRAA